MSNQHIALNHSFSASQEPVNSHILSNPLIARHVDLLVQAQEKFGADRVDAWLIKNNQKFERLQESGSSLSESLSLLQSTEPTCARSDSASSLAPPLTPRDYLKSDRRLQLEKVSKTVLNIPTYGKCVSLALYIDTLFRWLDYTQTHWHQDFITLNHHKIAKKLDINIRTSKRYLAEAKKLGYFHIKVVHHPKYGKELVISRVMQDPLSIHSTNTNNNSETSKVIHKRDNLAKVKGQPDLSNHCSPRVPAPLLSVEISEDNSSRSIASSSCARPDPQISREVVNSNPATSRPVLSKTPAPSSAKPEQTVDDDFAMKAYALFMLHIAIQFSPALQINQKMFAHLLKPLWKSHFGSLEAFEAYCLKIASNPFLTGKKPNKDGKFWQLRLQHILTGKMVEQSWANEGFFNVYEPRKPENAQEAAAISQKAQPLKLASLTLEEVVETAQNSTDAQVKTAMFHKIGANAYKSWFHTYGFTFEKMDGKTPIFTVSGNYAKKIIGERYYHQLAEAGTLYGKDSLELTSEPMEGMITMATGKVKMFNTEKGFGFISQDDGGDDVFVHISELTKSGLPTLEKGLSVSYDIRDNKGKAAAMNIKVL